MWVLNSAVEDVSMSNLFCFVFYYFNIIWYEVFKKKGEKLYIKDQDTGRPDTPHVEQTR